MAKQKNVPRIDELTKQLSKYPADTLGTLLREYLTETEWEGFSRSDLVGCRRFLDDFAVYVIAAAPVPD